MGERLLSGDRKFVLSKAQVRLAQAAMAAPRHLGVGAVPRARRHAGDALAATMSTCGARLREHGEKVLTA